MALDVQPWHCDENEWLAKHAPINSARCYEVGIAELRRRFLEGEIVRLGEDAPAPKSAIMLRVLPEAR